MFRDQPGFRIAGRLTASRLAGAAKLRDYWAEQQATRAGYDQRVGFGSAAHRQVALAKGIQQKLELQLRDQREISVKLETDLNEVIRVAGNEIRVLLERNAKEVAEGIKKDTTTALEELDKKLNGHLASHQLG